MVGLFIEFLCIGVIHFEVTEVPKIRQEKLVSSRYKDGIFYLWDRWISKKELCAIIPLEILQKRLKHHGNSNWVLFDTCKNAHQHAIELWIENTKDEKLKQRRKESWEKCPVVSDLYVDEMVREIRKHADRNNIDLRSSWEIHIDKQ